MRHTEPFKSADVPMAHSVQRLVSRRIKPYQSFCMSLGKMVTMYPIGYDDENEQQNQTTNENLATNTV
jgi:hypothetical protein